MTEVCFVRHGEVNGNTQKRFIGFTDEALNEKGIIQAQNLNVRMAGSKFDVAYVSSLRRTQETYGYIADKNLQSEPIICDDLRERNFGIFENLTLEEIKNIYPNEYHDFTLDWENYKIGNGENANESYVRVCTKFKQIIDQNQDKKILIVTHLGCIRYILGDILLGSLAGSWHFMVDNASMTKLELTDGFYVLKGLSL